MKVLSERHLAELEARGDETLDELIFTVRAYRHAFLIAVDNDWSRIKVLLMLAKEVLSRKNLRGNTHEKRKDKHSAKAPTSSGDAARGSSNSNGDL